MLHVGQLVELERHYVGTKCRPHIATLSAKSLNRHLKLIVTKRVKEVNGGVQIDVCSRVQKFPAAPNGKCCEGYIVPSMVRLMYQLKSVLK